MLSSIESKKVKTVWHKKFFDACKSRLLDEEYQAMIDELHRIIQKSVDKQENVVVSSFIPGSNWSGTVWDPIYNKACTYDEGYSAQFFGLLVCQALIERPETWYFIKQETAAKGMTYFMSEKDKKKVSNQEESLISKDKKEVSKEDESATRCKADDIRELWNAR